MSEERWWRRAGVAAAVTLALVGGVGCASDGGDGDVSADDAPAAPGTGADAQGADDQAASCPDELFTGTIERSEDPDAGHGAATLTDADVVDGVAYELLGAYTIYLADHEMDRGPLEEYLQGSFSTDNAMVAEPGGVLLTLGFGDYGPGGDNRVVVGDVLDASSPGQVNVLVDAGGGAMVSVEDPQGTVELLGATDDHVCVAVDYQDGLQQVQGTVSVPIFDG